MLQALLQVLFLLLWHGFGFQPNNSFGFQPNDTMLQALLPALLWRLGKGKGAQLQALLPALL